MTKLKPVGTKIYKPEILKCPFCNQKMEYKHTVSNKIIQFSSAKHFRIRNLGYGCNQCKNRFIYFSQTAVKMCFRGYTYSAKIICTILYYKKEGLSRDEIYQILTQMGVVISERNIDVIYNHFTRYLKEDNRPDIESEYNKMFEIYQQIRISIDLIQVEEYHYICVRNYFSGDVIGLHFIDLKNTLESIAILNRYLKDERVTHIITIRKQFSFYKLIKQMVPDNIKILEFAKF